MQKAAHSRSFYWVTIMLSARLLLFLCIVGKMPPGPGVGCPAPYTPEALRLLGWSGESGKTIIPRLGSEVPFPAPTGFHCTEQWPKQHVQRASPGERHLEGLRDGGGCSEKGRYGLGGREWHRGKLTRSSANQLEDCCWARAKHGVVYDSLRRLPH